jgi:hypothetical protein
MEGIFLCTMNQLLNSYFKYNNFSYIYIYIHTHTHTHTHTHNGLLTALSVILRPAQEPYGLQRWRCSSLTTLSILFHFPQAPGAYISLLKSLITNYYWHSWQKNGYMTGEYREVCWRRNCNSSRETLRICRSPICRFMVGATFCVKSPSWSLHIILFHVNNKRRLAVTITLIYVVTKKLTQVQAHNCYYRWLFIIEIKHSHLLFCGCV